MEWVIKHQRLCLVVVVVIVVTAAFAGSLSNGFVSDDLTLIVGNTALQDWSLTRLGRIWVQDVYAWGDPTLPADQLQSLFYRPFFQMFIMVCHVMAGHSAVWWHSINLLLHSVAIVLVVAVVYETLGNLEIPEERRTFMAGLAGVIFAVHPVQAESVAWVIGINTCLGGIWLFLAVWCFLRFRLLTAGQRRWPWLAGIWVACWCGVLTKENGVIFPLLVAGYTWVLAAPATAMAVRMRQAGLNALLLGWPVLPFLALRFWIFGSLSLANPRIQNLMAENNPENLSLGWVDTFLTLPQIVMAYGKMLLVPFRISPFFDGAFVQKADLGLFWLPLVGMIILGTVLFYGATRKPAAQIACLWVMVGLLPTLGLPFMPMDQIVQSRHLYLPMVGVGLAIVVFFESLYVANRLPLKVLQCGVVVGFILLCFMTNLQNQVFRDNFTFFNDSVAWSPHAKNARLGLASAWEFEAHRQKASGQPAQIWQASLRQAEYQYLQAQQISPQMMTPTNRLGFLYWELGEVQKATTCFEKIAQIRSYQGIAHSNLGFIYEAQGRTQDAVRAYEQALHIDPGHKLARQWKTRLEKLRQVKTEGK